MIRTHTKDWLTTAVLNCHFHVSGSWDFYNLILGCCPSAYCCSVAKSCATLCDPMDCSPPCSSALHYLLEFAQKHPLSWWCHPTISSSVVPFPSHLQSFPALGSFPTSQFASGGQSMGVSTSASVLPMNIQDWFPLGLTGLISCQSKGLSRVVSQSACMHACQVTSVWLCMTLCNTMDHSLPGSSVHRILSGKNTGVGCHALLQGLFPTRGSNSHLFSLTGRQVL